MLPGHSMLWHGAQGQTQGDGPATNPIPCVAVFPQHLCCMDSRPRLALAPSLRASPRCGCSWKHPQEGSTGRPRPPQACSGRRTPSPTSLPGSQQVADGVPGTDEHLGLVAPEHGGFAGWDLDVPVYFHWFRVVIWGREQEQTCGSPAQGKALARQLGFADSDSVWGASPPSGERSSPAAAAAPQTGSPTLSVQGGAQQVYRGHYPKQPVLVLVFMLLYHSPHQQLRTCFGSPRPACDVYSIFIRGTEIVMYSFQGGAGHCLTISGTRGGPGDNSQLEAPTPSTGPGLSPGSTFLRCHVHTHAHSRAHPPTRCTTYIHPCAQHTHTQHTHLHTCKHATCGHVCTHT